MSKLGVLAEGGVLGISAIDIFADLQYVGLTGLQFSQLGVSCSVLRSHLLAPLRAVLARAFANAAGSRLLLFRHPTEVVHDLPSQKAIVMFRLMRFLDLLGFYVQTGCHVQTRLG